MDGIHLRDLGEDFIRMEMAGKDDDSMICGRFIFSIVRVYLLGTRVDSMIAYIIGAPIMSS